MKNLSLLVVFMVCFAATRSNAQRWYSYTDYLDHTTSTGYSLMDLWNDTTAIFGFTGAGGPTYYNNKFTSVGMSFAPRLSPWNNVAVYGSTIKVGPGDVYYIDSVRIFGNYSRNNAKPLVKDTLRIAFVNGDGTATTNLQEYSITGGIMFSSYGYDPVNYLEMVHDSVKNIAGKYTGVAAVPYIQSIILGVPDTSIGFNRSYALTAPYMVSAGRCAAMSLTFKSGDASYTPFDTIVYASGSYKYGLFDPAIGYAGTVGAPVFAPYSPSDSNVGYFKQEGAADIYYAGYYTPTWAWSVGGVSPAELQYPAIDFHINCPTCDLNDTITGTTHVCAGSTTTLSHSLAGGTWSSSATGIATIGLTSGIAGGVSGGVVTMTYTWSGHHTYTTFTVYPSPGAISGLTSVCAGSSITLTDATGGGTWSSGSSSVATIGLTSGILHGSAPGTTVISYTLPSGCSRTITITVNPAPSPIAGTTSVCTGLTTALTSSPAGGAWTSGSTSIATVVAGSGVVTGVTTGSTIISYTVAGCITTTTVTVGTTPVAGTITGGSSICVGATTTLSDPISGGVWSSTSSGIASVNTGGTVTGIAAGSATISYTVTNFCGTAAATASIVVNPLPDAGAITGTDTVCEAHSITLADLASGGVWTSSNTSIATVSSSGTVYGVSGGVAGISYSVSNSCGTADAAKPVYVIPATICALDANGVAYPVHATIKIAPNPNSGTFTINLLSNNDENIYVTISNIVGEKIKEFTATTNKAVEIELNQVPGIYFLSAVTASGRYVEKVTVE